MTNLEITELLRNVASAYQYKDENKYKFQIIAYNRAADSIEHLTSELKDLWDDGKLEEVPSIGPSIARHLDEIFRTGKSTHFEKIMKGIPKEAFVLMILPKVGLKTAIKMIKELPKFELIQKIKEAERLQKRTKRYLLPYAENVALEISEWLKKCPEVAKLDILGSLRRKTATIGDIDILVSTKKSKNPKFEAEKIMNHFVNYPKVQKIIEKGLTTSSILLPSNMQVDVLITKPESYGNALQHFTGSKNHNVALREYSLKNGWSMNEFRIKSINTRNSNVKLKQFKTEQELYQFLGLDYIEPELREGVGEIQASLKNSLPNLVELKEIKGDLQIHSNFNTETSHDLGENLMEEIIKKAKELNYEYIAFTEHNPSKNGHTSEQIVDILKRKKESVEQLNYSSENDNEKGIIKVFNSLEIDINKNGSLPVSDRGMDTLDFALVSIHSVFDLSRFEMTKRVLTALSHPKVKIFAHPTARRINVREGVELDWEQIFDFCLKNNKWIEINADPMRLDLPDSLVRDAVKLGVKMTLGTDAHEISMMDNMRYGVYVARRGWAEKKDIVNTSSLKELEKMLE